MPGSFSASPTGFNRDGDTWSIAWQPVDIAMGFDGFKETRDGLRADVTVESGALGRVLGPAHLNLLSVASQKTFATLCSERVNGLSKDEWLALVVAACSRVTKQWRAPEPIYDLGVEAMKASAPLRYVVPGWIPANESTLLYADGGSCKSLLALHIAFCVASGTELPWGVRPEQGEVLYLDWETNLQTTSRRLRRIALGELCTVPRIHYRQCFRPLADELPSIREEISKRGISLVVVDSIGFAAAGALNEDETARAAMNGLRSMQPATRLVVAHVSKGTAESTSSKAKPFGSAFFYNGMRSGIEVRRAEDQPNPDAIDIGLYHVKTNDDRFQAPLALRIDFDGSDGGILFSKGKIDEAPDLLARTSLAVRLRTLLRSGKQDTEALAEETDSSSGTVYKTLKRMPDVQQLESGAGRGKRSVWGLKDLT